MAYLDGIRRLRPYRNPLDKSFDRFRCSKAPNDPKRRSYDVVDILIPAD
jgi:hypothetical protein